MHGFRFLRLFEPLCPAGLIRLSNPRSARPTYCFLNRSSLPYGYFILLAVRYIPFRSPRPGRFWGIVKKYPALCLGLASVMVLRMGAGTLCPECFCTSSETFVQVLSSVVPAIRTPAIEIRVQTLLHLVDYLHKFGHSNALPGIEPETGIINRSEAVV